MQSRIPKAHLALIGANVIFGLNTPIAKAVLSTDVITPYALTFLRMAGAACLFWVASLFVTFERVPPKDLLILFLASLFGIQLNQVSFLIGLSMTSPIDASIIATLVPILTMFIAALYLKEPITWLKAAGVSVGAGGALLLILQSTGVTHTDSSAAGNLLCILSATSYAIYLTIFKKIITKYSSITLMKWMFLFAAVCCSPLYYRDVLAVDTTALTWENYLSIGFVVVFATFTAYLLIPIGQKQLRPTVVSTYNYMQPVIASLVAVAMGLSVFGWSKGLAAALVCTGVYLVTKSKSRAQVEAELAQKNAKKNNRQEAINSPTTE